jgi:predicted membrane protein
MGDVVLDLRGAEVPQGKVDITATAVMGDIKIHVPDGVDVQLSGIAVMGDKKVQVREAPAGQAAPRVVVRATVVMGDVKVLGDSSAEPARRTLRAWLTRDDRDRRAIE